MRVHLLGVRGSIPTPGTPLRPVRRQHLLCGHRPRVRASRSVRAARRRTDPGARRRYGIRALPAVLGGAPFDGSLLLTHLHWDHVEGLPFCTAIDRDDARCDLYLPVQADGRDAADAIGRMMSPPNFPIGPEGLLGQWTFSSLEPGPHKLERFSVTATEVAHKGGTTFGYRVSDGDACVAYLPDHCPTVYGPGPDGWGELTEPVMDLVRQADVLIHDAQLTADQLPDGAAYGHTALEYAVALGTAARVGTVVLFHHSPRATDDGLEAVADRYRDRTSRRWSGPSRAPSSSADHAASAPRPQPVQPVQPVHRFIAGPAGGFAADTAEAIAAVGADALLADAFLFGSIIAAQAVSLPVVLLVSNIWIMPARGTPPIGPGFAPARTALGRGRDAAMVAVVNRLFAKGLPPVNRVRSEYGLAPLTSFYDQALSVDRILVLTSPEFDYASATVPPNVSYVGPILDDPEWTEPWAPPWAADDERPLVLVGFSTTYQNQGPVLRRVVEALSTLPVRAVVTRGQMLGPADVASSDNVAVVASVPHQSVLPHASLVISHCGHGTTMKALAAGVPLVCIPMGRDQNDTAARVVEAGAGVRLRPNASAAWIRTAVRQVLGDGRFRDNADGLATAIRDGRCTADLVTEIEAATGAQPVA